ncbi:MAG: dockerin type I repeat-containing protein [Gammaproteobacteria bacterium]|nr:dockerin type I repeat-containing protein [Gammaproteobacteria bacterium]
MGAAGSNVLAAVATTFADDVGYTALQAELLASVPDGSGLTVTIVEACIGDPCGAWAPDPGIRSVTDGDGGPQVSAPFSGHATGVGNRFYGDASITPVIGIPPNPSVAAYEANNWLQDGALRFGQAVGTPLVSASRIANHSWVGTTGNDAYDTELLKRLDWLVDTDEYVQVAGYIGNSSAIFGSARNAIAVNKTGSPTNSGSTVLTSDAAYASVQTRPDLVAPESSPSTATPRVAATAALLMHTARLNPSFSNGSTTNRNNDTILNAERSEVVKAALMAGAERATSNTHPTGDPANIVEYRAATADQRDNGLDRRYGAGQLNVYNSYHIVAAGEQDSLQENGVGSIEPIGFDYEGTFGGSNGSNSQATYFFTTGTEAVEFVAALVWNIKIDPGGNPAFGRAATLYDLDLHLFDVSDGGNWVLVLDSTSANENTENIRAFLDAATPYALQVNRGSGQGSFRWDYALAWRTRVSGDVNGDDRIDVRDLTLMQQAITGIRGLDQQQRARADVYPAGGDGNLDIADLLALQKLALAP